MHASVTSFVDGGRIAISDKHGLRVLSVPGGIGNWICSPWANSLRGLKITTSDAGNFRVAGFKGSLIEIFDASKDVLGCKHLSLEVTSMVTGIEFCRLNANIMSSTSVDLQCRIWDTRTRRTAALTLKRKQYGALKAEWRPRSETQLLVSDRTTCSLWDLRNSRTPIDFLKADDGASLGYSSWINEREIIVFGSDMCFRKVSPENRVVARIGISLPFPVRSFVIFPRQPALLLRFTNDDYYGILSNLLNSPALYISGKPSTERMLVSGDRLVSVNFAAHLTHDAMKQRNGGMTESRTNTTCYMDIAASWAALSQWGGGGSSIESTLVSRSIRNQNPSRGKDSKQRALVINVQNYGHGRQSATSAIAGCAARSCGAVFSSGHGILLFFRNSISCAFPQNENFSMVKRFRHPRAEEKGTLSRPAIEKVVGASRTACVVSLSFNAMTGSDNVFPARYTNADGLAYKRAQGVQQLAFAVTPPEHIPVRFLEGALPAERKLVERLQRCWFCCDDLRGLFILCHYCHHCLHNACFEAWMVNGFTLEGGSNFCPCGSLVS
ncbi:hypothetical protein BJ508DRAFT_414558 [Ascobolus immersus RN42]|uniref:WD40 repeat-like protein n=1 Tax=Ascobolus immersus RN42 TaxID=1160509 RepID=A0A3N4I6Y5_ASCIM|nr:hypothetical protein BJ508DRAFT_414558 [Ascobolus immersus RN42]